MKGGELIKYGRQLFEEIKVFFDFLILVYCLVYVFEVVIFVLQLNIKIFFYFGIFNIKWMLYIFLIINDKFYLNVVNEKVFWCEGKMVILFDDSY